MEHSFLSYARAIAKGSGTQFSSLTQFRLTWMSVERWLHVAGRSLMTVRHSCVMKTLTMLLLLP